MFREIFLFELRYRLSRPAVYLYFATVLIFTMLCQAEGALHLSDKVFNNAPVIIAFWSGGVSMILMLVNSSLMGMPLYRDIEYNTKDYYLTYPITKAGYFWGRYFGSIFFVLLIGTSVLLGLYAGTILGPLLGWQEAGKYGPNRLIFYLYPFFSIIVPNLFFTSSIFFGLTAITRNIKVIYSSGLLLFLAYCLSSFFIDHTHNTVMINIADPFAINGIRLKAGLLNAAQQNTSLIELKGSFLVNRILWVVVGLIVLSCTYTRFNFKDFFSGRSGKYQSDSPSVPAIQEKILSITADFSKPYNQNTLIKLTKTELLNIIHDNYFWIIMISGILFLGFTFGHGSENYGVQDFPKTTSLFEIFNDSFLFFLFFIIIFYTGESVHRDRITRFAFIADTLPPSTWILSGSKLFALMVLGFFLSILPLPLGIIVQFVKGYTQFNLPLYIADIFLIILPRVIEMVLFSFAIHVIVNNKFAAHIIGITIWILFFFLLRSGALTYRLLLYSYTPMDLISDMNGIGHMLGPISAFNLYWLFFGGMLAVLAYLLYYRGIVYTLKERLKLAAERFNTRAKYITAILLTCFILMGSYIYYNVSYLNNYLTTSETEQRKAAYEQQLKKYSHLPVPKITNIKLYADFFPARRQHFIKAYVTMINRTDSPIKSILLNCGETSTFNIKCGGKRMPVSYPLIYSRGKFDWFRPEQDTSGYRLYEFEQALAPGDSAMLEINSSTVDKAFRNDFYAPNLLENGIFFSNALPAFGYEEDDELTDANKRKKYHLPERIEEEVSPDDPEGIRTLRADNASYMYKFDITVSTAADQTAVAPGQLERQWQNNGRNYFHYVQDNPAMYAPFAILSARFRVMQDSVQICDGRKVNVAIYHHPAHRANLDRFMRAYKDGLQYFSHIYGPYPFGDIRLAESSIYGPEATSFTTMDTYSEAFGWQADFTNPDQTDYCYFITARQLAQQWWRFQVAPNNTAGSLVITEGISKYSAFELAEKRYGKNNMQSLLAYQLNTYLFLRRHQDERENILLRANQWFTWETKAGNILYGLGDLIGSDSLHAALREFKEKYAFRDAPPFAGGYDLYRILRKHVPDSLQYYLTDSWEKITLYDNKVLAINASPTANPNEYSVCLKVWVDKKYINENGSERSATQMNDYIDLGLFAADSKGPEGRTQRNPLYLRKYKLSAGEHTIHIIVNGKPVSGGIDPYNKLLDFTPDDNRKNL